MQNLVSFLGMFVLIFGAWLASEDRKRFPWRVVAWGLVLQMVMGFVVLRWPPGIAFFSKLNAVFDALLSFSKQGALFVFNSVGAEQSDPGGVLTLKEYLTRLGAESKDPVIQNAIRTGAVPGFFFAFQVLTTIIFFSAVLSILYYLGVMQKVVLLFAKLMAKTMNLSGAESLSNSANIFVGQTEAPLVVAPYLKTMTRSELMAIMVGGFSNTAGGVLGAYVMMLSGYFPNIAAHLITASLLSAPAAFIFAKVLVPEKEEPLTRGEVRLEVEIQDANLVDAAASGTTVGWQLAINVAAMLVSFVALVFMANRILSWVGGFFHDTPGLVTFDLAVLAALAVLFFVPHRTGQRDLVLWGGLALVIAVYALLRAATSVELAWGVAMIGIGAWLPLFFAKDEPRRRGTVFWAAAFGVLAAINVAFFAGGPLPPGQDLSLQVLLGWLHWPVAFVMGVPVQDCFAVGQILGEKLVLTEFVAYADLANRLGAAQLGTAAALDPRSVVIVSYALCGFANIASIGIQIGGIAPLAPERRHDIARLGVKAMIGGALATFMIACVAGTFYHGVSTLGLPAAR